MHRYRQLFRYARPHRALLAVILVLTVAVSVVGALQPWPMKLLVDNVLGRAALPPGLKTVFEAFALDPLPTALLAAIALSVLVLFALQSALNAGLTWAWTIGGRRMVYDLAEDLFSRLQRRSTLYHLRHPVGDTMGRVTADTWCVYQVVDTLLFAPGHALLAMTLMIVLMMQLDVTLTWLSLAVAPFMVGASFLVGKPLRAVARLKRDIESRIQSHLHQTLTGIPVVQAFVQEEREQQRFRGFADAAIAAQQRSALLGSVNSLSSGLITTLGTGAILWVGARHFFQGTLSIGGILVFLVYLASLQAQMKVLAELYTRLQGISASVNRVIEVLDAVPEVAEQPGAITVPSVQGHVQFQNVTFGYTAGHPVLRGISLDTIPGQTVAIVGTTGAGKTTLVNLIPRFFDPWEGCVRVDGRSVRELALTSLRRHIGLVLQEPYLFPYSVADNIAFGRPEASRGEIEAAARLADAHEFISGLPSGYDTVIGERGATLSGGERQRLAIARALLRDAPILILDEPTSALDASTEKMILEALNRLMRGRTTFLIAHRLSTIRRADRILVLDGGRIAECGTHDELLARGELYARMHHTGFASPQAIASATG